MEPPRGLWSSIWNFILFLPFFIGLLILGIIKGAIFCPLICLIMFAGNSAVVIGLWPVHMVWTWYCIARTKQLGPVLKIVLFVVISAILLLWPLVAVVGIILGGAAYGFLAPLVATFEAVGKGKTNEFIHCIVDGTWSTIEVSFTAIRDFADVCYHSFFSFMDDHLLHEPLDGKPREIRVLHLLGGLIVGLLGILADVPAITIIALYKSPFMLFKGWHRLVQDLIGREGPFLETACVPFAGLAILLWPVAVIGAVVASILSSFVLGGFAAVVVYQESSVYLGLAYIISSLSIFDEHSNDVLGMAEGSCFPRLKYRKNKPLRSGSISRHSSFVQDKNPPSRSVSFKNAILELKPIKLLEHLFMECGSYGETLVSEGIITSNDIEECLTGREGGGIVSIGLPAFVILKGILRSVDTKSDGLLLSDGTEITSMNRPKETFFDWFFDPLMIMKEQIKVANLSIDEQNYITKLVLLLGDPERLRSLNSTCVIESERRKAEIDALGRRLQGITKSISRYPTVRRRFDSLAQDLARNIERSVANGPPYKSHLMERSKSSFHSLFGPKRLGSRMNNGGRKDEIQEAQESPVV